METKKFLPRAIPLVTVDPYFNIWSTADHLYDDAPRHWTGKRNAMTGCIQVDGVWYRFMGKIELNNEDYYLEPKVLEQKSVELTPTKTIYVFENEQISLEVEFMTPLLMDDLKLMSRPVSYISYKVSAKDGQAHKVKMYLDITSEAAVNTSDQAVEFGVDENSIFCGRGDNDVLAKSGDGIRIDWGWLHLAAPDHEYLIMNTEDKKRWLWGGNESLAWPKLGGKMTGNVGLAHEVRKGYPALGCARQFEVSEGKDKSGMVCLAYDDIRSIQYFGKDVEAYWRKDGETFGEVLVKGIEEYEKLREKTKAFDEELKKEAMVYGEKYYDILCVAYRESIAGHKLIEVDGELQFFSKECYSNGCIGTVDITYPSAPLYLKYCPQLVEGMLNPIFHLVSAGLWPFEFAPHDVGQYPLANGQVYGMNPRLHLLEEENQMPVEECGNMILTTAAVCKAEGNAEYAAKHKEILTQWADYLVRIGWNPENQLCTDDFAGHLAHNCNLSIKGILAVGAWGKLLSEMGEEQRGTYYVDKAKELAVQWEKEAFDGDHYRLTFDREDSWSLKYNLIWDKLLGLHIFDEKIAETEVTYYLTKFNPYGIPLDCRCDYTKSDWEMWSAVLTDNEEYRNKIIDTMWDAQCAMDKRAPLPDWYHTEKAVAEGFQNRTVQGGLFVLLLNR
ncbi:MAG: DUF4965 domain-containing protein [Clostridiales bacterium]|nr:DUF4965 domain-containing protein [Clostridiales bacterium]